MKQNGWIPLHQDFPVEDISLVKKLFYAAVAKMRKAGLTMVFRQRMRSAVKTQVIRGMTIWASKKANFEENEKGSIEKESLQTLFCSIRDLAKSNL